MTREDARHLVLGVYVLYWRDGGFSIASVGQNEYGDRWYAPSNWLVVPSFDWDRIRSVARIDPHVDNYGVPL